MKAVILAGGLGTRLSEETHLKPKPMVEIGGKPILWHILKIYSTYGVNDFVICCGYKGYVIKEYFANYFLHSSDVTFHMSSSNQMQVHSCKSEPWKVTLVDTGDHTQTGGRLLRVRSFLEDQTFFFTYGDGLSDLNLSHLLQHHHESSCTASLTAVRPPGRYGLLQIESGLVRSFHEKADSDSAFINGGFFALEPSIFSHITCDETSFELDVLPTLATKGQLSAFTHTGFWHAMDTLRDRNYLDRLWLDEHAPWRSW